MGLYNFEPRFVPAILSGRKRHTIRAIRANPDKPGNTLHLYTGLRHPGAKLLMRAPCVKVESIEIHDYSPSEDGEVIVDGITLSKDEREALARCDGFSPSDGFTAWFEMLEFWEGRLPFTGHIIHWDYDAWQMAKDQKAARNHYGGIGARRA